VFFPLLFAFDGLIAAVFVYFFAAGLADGSVSSFNLGLWLGILAANFAVLGAAVFLKAKGYSKAAIAVLLVPAFPALCFALFLLAVLILQPRWN
jgi:hypothetical protein